MSAKNTGNKGRRIGNLLKNAHERQEGVEPARENVDIYLQNITNPPEEIRTNEPLNESTNVTMNEGTNAGEPEKKVLDNESAATLGYKRFAFDLPIELHKRLKMTAVRKKRNMYQIVTRAIRLYLNQLDLEDGVELPPEEKMRIELEKENDEH